MRWQVHQQQFSKFAKSCVFVGKIILMKAQSPALQSRDYERFCIWRHVPTKSALKRVAVIECKRSEPNLVFMFFPLEHLSNLAPFRLLENAFLVEHSPPNSE